MQLYLGAINKRRPQLEGEDSQEGCPIQTFWGRR